MKTSQYSVSVCRYHVPKAAPILSILLFAATLGTAQMKSKVFLKGRWHAERFGVHAYYDFVTDSTYRYWTSNTLDSNTVFRISDLPPDYFHFIGRNHFYTLITFYATEKLLFSRQRVNVASLVK